MYGCSIVDTEENNGRIKRVRGSAGVSTEDSIRLR